MYRLAVVCAIVMLSLDQPLEAETIPIYSNDFSVGAGNEWSHRVLDTTPTGRPFLGRFTNQDTTRLSVGAGSIISPDGLPRHNLVSVSLDLYIIHSWDGAPYGGDEWILSVDGGPVLLDTSFSNPLNGTADNPQNYPGTYGGDLSPARTGAAEVNTLGYWNVYPTRFGDSVYHLAFTFPHTADTLALNFRANGFTGTPLSGLQDESWGLDNVAVAVIVPEPATLSMLALASLLLARRRRVARVLPILLAAGLLAGSTNPALADVFNMGGTRNPTTGQWTGLASLETAPVGDPGNAADTRYEARGIGRVDYEYRIGRYEVTAGQYCEFLNAVAKTDPYGLYATLYMNYDANPNGGGCNIKRTGSAGNYGYTVPAEWANRPVNHVSWADAVRFCNWLTNNQPSGVLTGSPGQDAWLTEDGSYSLNGATEDATLSGIVRRTDAKYVIPTEDEWYKAAYYDARMSGGAGYWAYPTRSNAPPSNVLDPAGTNNANSYGPDNNIDLTIGGPYYRTEVGAFAGSPSPWDTFDQGGNVVEWTESVSAVMPSYRTMRGGAFESDSISLWAGRKYATSPDYETDHPGFRIALVPEPATLCLLALGGLLIARRRRA